MNRWFLHILFCLISAFTFGQEMGSESVKELNREALQLNREGKFEEAEKLLEDLLTVLEEQEAEIAFKALAETTDQGQAIPIGVDQGNRIIGTPMKIVADFQVQVGCGTAGAKGVAGKRDDITLFDLLTGCEIRRFQQVAVKRTVAVGMVNGQIVR